MTGQNGVTPLRESGWRAGIPVARLLSGREVPRERRPLAEGLAHPGYVAHAAGRAVPASRPAAGRATPVLTTLLFLLAPIVARYPLPGLGSELAWLLIIVAATLLAAQWRIRGAAIGIVVSLLIAGFAYGLGGIHGQRPDIGAFLSMNLILIVVLPAIVGWAGRTHATDAAVRGLADDAQQLMDDAQTAYRVSEARFRSLVEHASDLITVLDADGYQRYVSPSFERLLGYAADDLVDTNFFGLVHPADNERVFGFYLARLATPLVGSPIEFRCRTHAGEWQYLEASFTNLLGESSVGGIVVNARDVTERVQFQERLSHQAFHDPLTGLPNRALFFDRLTHALASAGRDRHSIGVLFLDLDRFKLVNDSLGHAVGDALLVEVSKVLSACVRPGDTVARLGGDEFAILVKGTDEYEAATGIAARIIEQLRQPFRLAGHDVVTATSIGIVFSAPRHEEPATLLQEADVALYRAKAAGRGCYLVFDPSMNARALAQLDLEADMRQAVEHQEFHLHYQPEVDAATGVVVCMEALVRWDHPRRGVIPPAEFLPLAEDCGLILSIEEWVLEEACRQASHWQQKAPADHVAVSVNISGRLLQHPHFVRDVARILQDTGLPPASLRLEINEAAAMRHFDSAIATLQGLRELGVGLALDNFGTGNTSLSQLQCFPLDTLKVDRSLIHNLGTDERTAAIVQAVAALAHALNLTVTAEGIETRAQWDDARRLGCDLVQGFCVPTPAWLAVRGARSVA